MQSVKTQNKSLPQRKTDAQIANQNLAYGKVADQSLFDNSSLYGKNVTQMMSNAIAGMHYSTVPIQRKHEKEVAQSPQKNESPEKVNNTGMPDNLKSGIEAMSGLSMDGVKVHYNSDKPKQLKALAYAQGNDIFVGSGQEKHLPHEAWHVVQQKEGRVEPTRKQNGLNINDDKELENEADRMGNKAMQFKGYGTPVTEKGASGSSNTAQLYIESEPSVLLDIINKLKEAYKDKVEFPVILKEALDTWVVNGQGRSFSEEVIYTLDNFKEKLNLNFLWAKINKLETENEVYLIDAVKRSTEKVNKIQGNAYQYPHKLGSGKDVYGNEREGVPSSDTSKALAKDLRDELENKEVWKYKWDKGKGERVPAGYMMGVAITSSATFAAYSGSVEPTYKGNKPTFTDVARTKNFTVKKDPVSVDLTDLSRSVSGSTPEGVVEWHDDNEKHDYKVVKQDGESASAEIGSCAGTKLAKLSPLYMTEVWVGPDSSSGVKINDNDGNSKKYNNESEEIPSCLNCQFVIPMLLDNGDIVELQSERLKTTLVKVTKEVMYLEALEKINKEEVISQVITFISLPNAKLLRGYEEDVRDEIGNKFDEEIDRLKTSKPSVQDVMGIATRIYGRQKKWMDFVKKVEEQRIEEAVEEENNVNEDISQEIPVTSNLNVAKGGSNKSKSKAKRSVKGKRKKNRQVEKSEEKNSIKGFAWLLVLVVILAILSGLYTLGSGNKDKNH
ncbi:hypothetical protein MYP_1754 [Sporocytophaga myxococcoides]|uniref:eCIS core domain-containing protein n=1 Tax=Sporocytophaga myxococcoides TaxID=153721 RepID=A0A098LC47_9BACT|nr:DUF4157 domain-containing protein [Sporocytophaga myxococcoides]GAL84526.1 hypothetical protein MYP_1754 [Sporocytophaga myxococcoides]